MPSITSYVPVLPSMDRVVQVVGQLRVPTLPAIGKSFSRANKPATVIVEEPDSDGDVSLVGHPDIVDLMKLKR